MKKIASAALASVALAAPLVAGVGTSTPAHAAAAPVKKCTQFYAPGTNISPVQHRQVMIATHRNGTTHGSWVRYEWRDWTHGCWVKVSGSSDSIFGSNGAIAGSQRVQGDNKTPLGTYPIEYAFGERNPGTKMAYKVIHNNSVWVDDASASDYNRWRENGPANGGNVGEDLSAERDAGLYREAAVIGFNYDKPIRHGKGSGSGIFLHFARSYTAGCVGLNNRTELNNTIRWMDPKLHPVIVTR